MELGPGEHEPELAAGEAALDRLEGVDPDLGVTVGVLGVEMRVTVVVVVHPDHDPVEAADARHATERMWLSTLK